MRGHVRANVMRLEGAGGANRRCDCDGYRPDTLGGGIGQAPAMVYFGSAHEATNKTATQTLKQAQLLSHPDDCTFD